MNVLHVISDENIGGAGILLLNLLSCMNDPSINNVVAIPEASLLRGRLEAMNIPTLPLTYPCNRISASSIRELCRHIQDRNVDIVHANAALAARIAGRFCGIRIIHTRHCCFPPSGILRFPAVRALGGVFNRLLSDRAIATANEARKNLEELGFPKNRIDVIINGSKEVRGVDACELEALRRKLKLSQTDFIVGICARLEPYKGHKTFLESVRLCKTLSPSTSFRFLIIGDGSLRQELVSFAQTLGIEDQVIFTGFVSDPAPFYRLMRVNVNCSCGTETSCLALSEGMSASLPMIASDYGGNRAMIGEGLAGITVPVNDPRALAQAICHIAENPELEKKMRNASRKRFEEYYTAERMTEQVRQVYYSVL